MDNISTDMLNVAKDIAAKSEAKGVMVYGDVFSEPEDLKSLLADPAIFLVTNRKIRKKRTKKPGGKLIEIPPIELTRMTQIKMAILLGMLKQVFKKGDTIVCLTGAAGSEKLDTLVISNVGEELETVAATGGSKLTPGVDPAVFERVITIATELAMEGREGHPIGALFVVGDTENVKKYCSQLVINPFRGYDKSERNILREDLEETIKEFAALDGAFIIEGDGTIVSAGTYLRPGMRGEQLPQGLGARHEAAASITASTKAIAVTISQSTGTVTAFKNGKILTEIEKPRRTQEAPPVERNRAEPARTRIQP